MITVNSMTIYDQIGIRIIKEQELIIGPVAWTEAGKVTGLVVDQKINQITINGQAKEVLDKLVEQYSRLFGQASNEVCREAVHDLVSTLSPEEVPSHLK